MFFYISLDGACHARVVVKLLPKFADHQAALKQLSEEPLQESLSLQPSSSRQNKSVLHESFSPVSIEKIASATHPISHSSSSSPNSVPLSIQSPLTSLCSNLSSLEIKIEDPIMERIHRMSDEDQLGLCTALFTAVASHWSIGRFVTGYARNEAVE